MKLSKAKAGVLLTHFRKIWDLSDVAGVCGWQTRAHVSTTLNRLPNRSRAAAGRVSGNREGRSELTDDSEVFDLLRDSEEGFVVGHARRLPVVPKTNHNNTVVLLQPSSKSVSCCDLGLKRGRWRCGGCAYSEDSLHR